MFMKDKKVGAKLTSQLTRSYIDIPYMWALQLDGSTYLWAEMICGDYVYVFIYTFLVC
jgi:hypothetical protein